MSKNTYSPGSFRRKRVADYRASIMTERFLTMMLKVCSNPEFSKVNTLQTLKEFIDTVPMVNYENDPSVYGLIIAISTILKRKIEGALDEQDLVEFVNLELENEVYNDVKDNIIFPTILSGSETRADEEVVVVTSINRFLRNKTILESAPVLGDLITDLSSGNVRNLDSALNELHEQVKFINDEFDKTESDDKETTMFHTTDDDAMREVLHKTYDLESSPKFVLKTGLKAFNDMLSRQGGFLGGKSYITYADTNTFKSALLRYFAKWIVQYNQDSFMEEFLKTGVRPTVLFYSLEDGMHEDANRYYTTYTKYGMSSCDNFEQLWRSWKEYYNSIIDVTHINTNKCNFDIIDKDIRKLEAAKYKVIAVIVDSFDLMTPSVEDRMMGASDDFQLLTNRGRALEKWMQNKSFPFLTAHQLNRYGNTALAELKQSGKTDLAKYLERSFISGSYDVERRFSFSMFIYVEYSKLDGEAYLEINRAKVKYERVPGQTYLVTKLTNGFVITDDYGKDFCSTRSSILPDEISVGGNVPPQKTSSGRGTGSAVVTNIGNKQTVSGIKVATVKSSDDTRNFGATNTGGHTVYDSSVMAVTALMPQFIMPPMLGAFVTPFTRVSKPECVSVHGGIEYISLPNERACTPFDKYLK